jgi:hypothetical protein
MGMSPARGLAGRALAAPAKPEKAVPKKVRLRIFASCRLMQR